MLGKYGTVVLVVIVGGAAAWWWIGTDRQTQPADNDAVVQEQNETTPRGTGSMRELMARGETLECSFAFTDEDGMQGEGTGFFAGEQMRVDAMYQQDGGTYMTSYILTDGQMYMWGEFPDGTFAMTMPAEDEYIDDFDTETDAPVGVDDDVSYECVAWSVDASVFTPPASVEFTDMGAMMEGMMQNMSQEDMEAMMQQMEEAGMPPAQQ